MDSPQTDPTADVFHAFNPVTGEPIEPSFREATTGEIDAAAQRAAMAMERLKTLPSQRRADLLRLVAEKMRTREPEIVARCVLETGYLRERVVGEFRRATGQLDRFADLTGRGIWDERQIVSAEPGRELAAGLIVPRPEVRRRLVPVGPVAVFGACNFPLAISVVGNDFVAAIAVGCPVIVKSHPSHPGTCDLLGRIVSESVEELDLPPGTFALLHGRHASTSLALVRHPAIAAVGFTGSPTGGRALAEAVLQRPRPIPLFAELGSTNPVFLAPSAVENRSEKIATGFTDSVRFGNGHMCTKPGVVVMLDRQCETWIERVTALLASQPPLPLLNASVAESFDRGIAQLESTDGVEILFGDNKSSSRNSSSRIGPWHRGPHWFATDALTAINSRDSTSNQDLYPSDAETPASLLHCETFGPVSLLVRCQDEQEMLAVAERFHGSLTTTLHADEGDTTFASQWLPIAERFAGRIIFNGWPTGMEIGAATQHGGPYPASLDGNSTSVGDASMRRFVRPVCYQNWPAERLANTGDWNAASRNATEFS